MIHEMLMNAIRLFESVGATVQLASSEPTVASVDAVIDVELDGRLARFVVSEKKRAPYPGELDSTSELRERIQNLGSPLLVAPYVSVPLGEALVGLGWSWVDEQGNADVRAPGLRVQRRVSASPIKIDRPVLPSGRRSWAIIRAAIRDGSVLGATEMAARAGTSQPRASQILARLTAAGYLERKGRSTWTADRSRLLDAFLEQYSGPGGSGRWFYSLDDPSTVADRAIKFARATSGDLAATVLAVSGDVAGDRMVPWRRPTQVTLYTEATDMIDSLDVVEARGQGDANVEVIFPEDTSLFDAVGGGRLLLAHPTQVIWDLLRHGGIDREEAAERVRAWLLSR